MAVRTTMQDLILRVRDLIGDNPADETTRVWTDQQLQDALDRERLDVMISDFRELVPHYTVSGGAWIWGKFYDPQNYGDWEIFDPATDDGLYDGGMNKLSPATSDYQLGRWTFTVNTAPPIYAVGRTYDVYGAAAAVVERWLAQVAQQFDFSVLRGVSFTVSQKRAGLLELLEQLRTESRPRVARLYRSDTYGAVG